MQIGEWTGEWPSCREISSIVGKAGLVYLNDKKDLLAWQPRKGEEIHQAILTQLEMQVLYLQPCPVHVGHLGMIKLYNTAQPRIL